MSLGNLAAERDEKSAGAEVRSATETLIAIIPTEVLAAYTALVAIAVTTVEAGEYGVFRWGAYAGFVLLAAAAPISSFRSKVKQDEMGGARRLPIVECAAAGAAAAAWGLVMPGTPLDLVLAGEAMTLASAGIVLGGGALLTFASTFLKRANKVETSAGVPAEVTRDTGPGETADLLGYRKLGGR
jgi:hypothetical protein